MGSELLLALPRGPLQIIVLERMDEDFRLIQPRGVRWRIARLPPPLTPGKGSRSPVLCILDQGCSIARHETQGTEVMPELSALAGEVGRPRGEVGRPRGEVEGARGHCRSSPSATRCGEEGFLDLVQATVF